MKYYYQNESKTKWTRIILNCIFYLKKKYCIEYKIEYLVIFNIYN